MPAPISSLSTIKDDEVVNMVIETPAGSRLKYKFEAGVFMMHKSLPQGFCYPSPFGFTPGTQGADGDPLDVLLITTLQPSLGTVAEVRIIGAVLVEQGEADQQPIRNDRFLAVPKLDHEDRPLATISDLPPAELEDLEHSFVQAASATANTCGFSAMLSPLRPFDSSGTRWSSHGSGRAPTNGKYSQPFIIVASGSRATFFSISSRPGVAGSAFLKFSR